MKIGKNFRLNKHILKFILMTNGSIVLTARHNYMQSYNKGQYHANLKMSNLHNPENQVNLKNKFTLKSVHGELLFDKSLIKQ